MATQPWHYLINTFYVQTVGSMKKALSLTVDHLAKLTANEADADILAIKTAFLPFHTAFVTSFNQLQSKLGLYKGKTQTFKEMLHEMSQEKLNEWRGQVFAVFPEGTPNATAIFPQGKQPFQDGTYEQRVEAVETLSETLATFTGQPTLITLGTAVGAYHTTLLGARALQQTDEGSTETLRTNLKTNHQTLCVALYRNLGSLMAKYAENPITVANYYDLSLLRSTGDDKIVIEITVNPGQIIYIDTDELGVDLAPDVAMKIEAAISSFKTYFATNINDIPVAPWAFNGPGEISNITMGDIGLSPSRMRLHVQNDGLVQGQIKITIG